MRTLDSRKSQARQVTCVACASHMHPEMVPWLQHSIGCEVRTAELGRYYQSTSSRAGRVAVAASPRP
jgi:hypothetical protein